MGIEFTGWGPDDGVPAIPPDGSDPMMLPVIPQNCADPTYYSAANPYELRMPSYTNEQPCGWWPLHVPHYWDLDKGDSYHYCLGQGRIESINEH